MQKKIMDDTFNEAYQAIAKIVVEHGDLYLPIFKRMQRELEQRRATIELKNLAAIVAAGYPK